MRPTLLIAVTVLALAGCDTARVADATPPAAPPAREAEVRPPPPISEQPLIWQPGHWDKTGTSYSWTSGAYVLRAGHGSNWQDGYWKKDGTGWTWVGPHWS